MMVARHASRQSVIPEIDTRRARIFGASLVYNRVAHDSTGVASCPKGIGEIANLQSTARKIVRS
jgi:hypothetical protein